MDALKGAAAALKNSPRLVRKKMMRVKKKTRKSLVQSIDDGITFCVKKLGDFTVNNVTDILAIKDEIRRMFSEAKMARIEGKKKLNDLLLTISCEKVMIEHSESKELLSEANIERISQWMIDERVQQIFSFVEKSKDDIMLCHVFITPKVSQAEAAVEAISEAFHIAEELREFEKGKQRNNIDAELSENSKYLYSDVGSCSEGGKADNCLDKSERKWNFFDEMDDKSSSENEEATDAMSYIYHSFGTGYNDDISKQNFDKTDKINPSLASDAARSQNANEASSFDASIEANLIQFE